MKDKLKKPKPGAVVMVSRSLLAPNADDAYEAVVSSNKCRNENHVSIVPRTRRGDTPKPGVLIGVHVRRIVA